MTRAAATRVENYPAPAGSGRLPHSRAKMEGERKTFDALGRAKRTARRQRQWDEDEKAACVSVCLPVCLSAGRQECGVFAPADRCSFLLAAATVIFKQMEKASENDSEGSEHARPGVRHTHFPARMNKHTHVCRDTGGASGGRHSGAQGETTWELPHSQIGSICLQISVIF